jgi:hypothetical protein
MRTDENATEADNKVARASDPELVDEVYPLDPPQEAETAVPECEQIDEEAEQNQGQPESWHTFETP